MSGVEWGQAVRPSVKDLISAVNELESYTDIEHEVTGTFLERETANGLGGLSGIAEVSRILGNTVVWNQLVNSDTTSVTIANNHKYIKRIGGTATLATSDGIPFSVTGGSDNVFDLTVMFGAGNEPQTVAEFEAMYGSDYKPYSAPALLSSHIAGIQGASACEFPAQTLRGIGTARDVMTRAGIERKIFEFTLADNEDFRIVGTDEGTGNIQFCLFLDSSKPMIANARSLVRTPKFTYKAQWYGAPDASAYTVSLNPSTRQILFTVPSTVSTIAAMQALMTGEKLAYSKATPTTETFAEPLDLTYVVESGGTEAWIVPDGTQPTSSAPTSTISYKMQYEYELITEKSFDNFCMALGTALNLDIEKEWNDVTKEWEFTITSARSNLNAIDISEREELYSIGDERDTLEPDVLEPIREVDENEQR